MAQQAAPRDLCYDGPGDVACDVCTRRKQKAVKTCLQCRVSYCDAHLLSHYQSPVLQAHKLVTASDKLWENICSRHNKALELFCRTDQQCICHLCSTDSHRGHDIVSAAAERSKRQKMFTVSQQNILQRIHQREKDVKVLCEEIKNINHSANRAVEQGDAIFTKLNTSTNRRRAEAREQIRDQERREVSRAEELRKHMELEVSELEGRRTELERISHIPEEDHVGFLHSYNSLSPINQTDPVSHDVRDVTRSFEQTVQPVYKFRDKLKDYLGEEVTNFAEAVKGVNVLLPMPPRTGDDFLQQEVIIKIKTMKRAFVAILFFLIAWTHPLTSNVQPPWTHREWLEVQGHCHTTGWHEPKTRAEFSQYKSELLEMDPYTAEQLQALSNNRRPYPPHHPQHPVTIIRWSHEAWTGRHYWEWHQLGSSTTDVVFAYNKDISRVFGYSDKAWTLRYAPPTGYVFNHRNSFNKIPGPAPSYTAIGAYLDHSAGTLSFYKVSLATDTMTLLHRVQTTFTQPLYYGIGIWLNYADRHGVLYS